MERLYLALLDLDGVDIKIITMMNGMENGQWMEVFLNQQAIHHIDALNYLLGPVKSVSSFYTNRINVLEAEDTLVAILKLESGALATFEATTAARPKDLEASLTITGENGEVEVGGIALNKIYKWNFIKKRNSDTEVKKIIQKTFLMVMV